MKKLNSKRYKYDIELEEKTAALLDNKSNRDIYIYLESMIEDIISGFGGGSYNNIENTEYDDHNSVISLSDCDIIIVRINDTEGMIFNIDDYGAWTSNDIVDLNKMGLEIGYGEFLFAMFTGDSKVKPIASVIADGVTKNNTKKYINNGFIVHIANSIISGRFRLDIKYEYNIYKNNVLMENYDV